jgi:hypothetical protein
MNFGFKQYEFKACTSRFSVSDSSHCQFQFSLVSHDTMKFRGPKNIPIEFRFEQYEFKACTSRFSVSDSSQCQFQFSLVAHDTMLEVQGTKKYPDRISL